MAFNGSGTFVLTQNFPADRDAGAPDHFVYADLIDNEFQNIKGGLENCLTRDSQTLPSADVNLNSKKISNLADATAATDAMNLQASDTRYARIGSGTRMLFQQTAAPAGWTKDTASTLDNTALRIVTGSATSRTTGDPFTTSFAAAKASNSTGSATTGATAVTINNTNLSLSVASTNLGLSVDLHALAVGQLPPHTHLMFDSFNATPGSPSGVGAGNSVAIQSIGGGGGDNQYTLRAGVGAAEIGVTGSTGSGGGHGHNLSGTTGSHGHTLNGTTGSHAHTSPTHTHSVPNHVHTTDLDVNYHDAIICNKD